jgi:DNA-binding SARP family transcriptional activator
VSGEQGLWIGVLGPLTGTLDGAVVKMPRGRCGVLLAVLAMSVGHPVGVNRLAELIWPEEQPEHVRPSVQSLVARMRGLVPATVITAADGYMLETDPEHVDLLRFRRLMRATDETADPGAAAALLDQALRLWRGEPLCDLRSSVLDRDVIPGIIEERLLAVQRRAELDLDAGRHDRVIAELQALTGRYQLREPFWGQLIRALAAAGRPAEAIQQYHRAREILAEKLGVDPSADLQALYQQLLRAAQPAGRGPAQRAAHTNAAARIVPRQLPAAVRHFAGRASELKILSELLPEPAAEDADDAVVISVIGGTAGIGKTALAVHWAHRVAPRFPDGQLYVNLRGFDPSGTPMAPAEAVRGFLDALGVPARQIPADPVGQAALYRSRLAGRRMLIVLDNARDAEQVQLLLPGSPGCLALVTSRNQLGGLIALNGAVPLTLDLLTVDEARDLLISRLGHERVRADEHAAAELIGLCARLPLALNVAAANAALHPARPLAQLAGELRDASGPLDRLTTGDRAADVRAVFSWSYDVLDPDAASVFRLLGLHPGPDISLPAAACLTALEPSRAHRALDKLAAAHLLIEHSPGRYCFHDLLGVYAAEQARACQDEAGLKEALRRVCDFYTHTGHAAARSLDPRRPPLRLDPPASGVHPHPLAGDPEAVAWFAAEHANLLAAQRTAATQRWHATVWQLAWTLSTFHYRRGHRFEELAVWQAALDAAAHLPDPGARIGAHRLIGRIHTDLGHRHEATEHLHQALTLAEHHQDHVEQARTHRQLAWAAAQDGDDLQALEHASRALALFRTLGQSAWEADALNAVGWYAARLGDYDTARTHCQTALTLHRNRDDREGAANTLDSLGYVEHCTGRYRLAIDYYRQALVLLRSLGNMYQSASTLDRLGDPHAALGQHQQARTAWHQALELYQQQGRTEDAERVQSRLDALTHPDCESCPQP